MNAVSGTKLDAEEILNAGFGYYVGHDTYPPGVIRSLSAS
jgi:hypothetical protein